jgi:TonB-linked SusC/RagA family outer membrane protein
MFKKLLTIVTMVLLSSQITFAQTGVIEGQVTDAQTGETVPGANVFLIELDRGDVSDANGNYSIQNVPSGTYTLTASFVGFETFRQTVQISTDQEVELNIQLQPGQVGLDEVVVTGYGTTTVEKSSVSAVTVGSESIANRPNVSVAQRLSGQVPGLEIFSSDGQPGSNTTINLRGVSSINGNTEPLFILDGMPINEDNFRSLNPDEIEDITVLKDAGATAIYGNRGANGVIIIETKKGSYGSGLQISYSGQVKSTTIREQDYNFLTGPEQLGLEQAVFGGNVLGIDPGENFSFTPGEGFENLGALADAPTFDWVDYFFDPSISNTHNLTLAAGLDNIRNVTALGYTYQDGALQESGLERFNIRNNFSGRSPDRRLNYGVNTSINYSINDDPTSIGTSGVNQNPALAAFQSLPYYTADEYPGVGVAATSLAPVFRNTPFFLIDKLATAGRSFKETKMVGSANASYQVLNNLELNLNAGADYQRNENFAYTTSENWSAVFFAQSGNENPGSQSYSTTDVFSYNTTANIKHILDIDGVHTISSGLYGELFQAFYQSNGYTNNGIDMRTFDPEDGSGYIGDNSSNDFFSNTVFANELKAGLISYFGTLDYDYDSTYGASLTLRRDASYRFSETNKWGTFYSIAGRWNVHNESFMDELPFDILKLRGSYGVTGNQRIVDNAGQFAYFGGASLTENLFATGTGYGAQNSVFLSQIGNNTLRWETIEQANIGLDVEMFESRLAASVDAYIRTTDDLFQNQPVSAITSVTSLSANVGSLENRGIDFSIEYDVLRSRSGLNLTVGLLGNYNKQEILDIPTPTNTVPLGNQVIRREGGPINEFYVYPYAGVNQENGNLLFIDAEGNITENPNPDTDRRYTGKNIYPDVSGSINLNAAYKGFSLTTQFTYAIGIYRFDTGLDGYVDPGNIGSFIATEEILDYWTPDNTDASQPSLSASNRSLDDFSDRFLVNSDYFRLRYVNIGYSLPSNLLQPLNLRGASIFVSGENLFTLTGWPGVDAASFNSFSSELAYPNPRILTFGIQLEL